MESFNFLHWRRHQLMSDQEEHTVQKYIGTLKWVVTLGWALIAGAFAIGIWVANQEIRISSFHDKIIDHEVSIKNHGTELNMIHVKQAVNQSDLLYIRSAIDRIEKKIP